MGEETTIKVATSATGVTVVVCTTNPWLAFAGIAGLVVVGVVAVVVSNSGNTQKN